LVEDKTAKILVDRILENLGKAIQDIFDIRYLPGGADDINQRLTTIMEISDNTYVLFDGDQKKSSAVDLRSTAPNDQDTSVKLKKLIKTQTGCDIKFHLDGGNQPKALKEEQTLELAKKYLDFYRENVFYLPLMIPEDIIWDEKFAKKLLKLLQPQKDISTVIKKSTNSKELIFNFCIECYGESDQYESTIIQFVTNWLNKKDDNFVIIKDLINILKK